VAELIVAFDVPSGREALALATRLPGLQWVKIGPVLFVREGPALVREFAARGLRVFLDLKWHDIPNTVAGAVTGARDLGVGMATVHCLGGRTMLEAAARAAGPDLPLVGVTVLTSHDAGELESVLGRGVPDIGFESERLARAAIQAGLRGIVASGQELGLLREALGPDLWIVVPGVRLPGDAAGDQARTILPDEAVRRGATHLVVGRSITAARDPVAAYQRLAEAVESGV
jgi:orotidine-5'-phosphate decarboxylase